MGEERKEVLGVQAPDKKMEYTIDAMELWAGGIMKRFDVKVIIRSNVAYPYASWAEKTIFIPSQDVYEPKAVDHIKAFLMHEMGHIFNADAFGILSKVPALASSLGVSPTLLHSAMNVVADISHHHDMNRRYPGNQWYIEKIDTQQDLKTPGPPIRTWLLHLQRYNIFLGGRGFCPPPELQEIVERYKIKEVTSPSVLSEAAMEIAKKCIELKKNLPPEQGKEPQISLDSTDNQQKDMDVASIPPHAFDIDGVLRQKLIQHCKKQWEPIKEKARQLAGDRHALEHIQTEMQHKLDTAKNQQERKRLKEDLRKLAERQKAVGDEEQKVWEKIHKLEELENKLLDRALDDNVYTLDPNREMAKQLIPLLSDKRRVPTESDFCIISQNLGGLLQKRWRTPPRLFPVANVQEGERLRRNILTALSAIDGREYVGGYPTGRRISRRGLWRYRTDGKCFERKRQRLSASAAVALLCDTSLSMEKISYRGVGETREKTNLDAMLDAVQILAVALRDVAEIELSVYDFGKNVTKVPPQRLEDLRASRGVSGNMGTATGHAVWYALQDLQRSSKIRKIIVIATDGKEQDTAKLALALRECRNKRIQVVTIAIGPQAMCKHYPNAIQVTGANCLIGQLRHIVRVLLNRSDAI